MKQLTFIKPTQLSFFTIWLTVWGILAYVPIAMATEYAVTGVRAGDVLSVRKWPGVQSKIIAQIPPEGTGIQATGKKVKKGRSIWAQVKWKTQTGWVNTRYITLAKANTQATASHSNSVADSNSHTHPANRCTRSVTHTHPNGKRSHTHRYSCMRNGQHRQATPRVDPNTHTHPANKCTRSITHTHPNGKRKHTHNYSCQGNAKINTGNAHRHPANQCTRSIFHSHPNGKRPHTHRYSCKK